MNSGDDDSSGDEKKKGKKRKKKKKKSAAAASQERIIKVPNGGKQRSFPLSKVDSKLNFSAFVLCVFSLTGTITF